MKRRFKLITSVASLAVAITLMMAGVLAAGTRTFDVGGSVNFTSQLVQASVVVELAPAVESAGALVFAETGVTNGNFSLTAADQVVDNNVSIAEVELDDTLVKFAYQVSITNNQPSQDPIFIYVLEPEDELNASSHVWLDTTTSKGTDGTLNYSDIAAGLLLPASAALAGYDEYTLSFGDTLELTFTFVATPGEAPTTTTISYNSSFALYSLSQYDGE